MPFATCKRFTACRNKFLNHLPPIGWGLFIGHTRWPRHQKPVAFGSEQDLISVAHHVAVARADNTVQLHAWRRRIVVDTLSAEL
ncbi:MAG: hypothetical protein JWP89_4119 [Schlesneria sp.]|nr:hypothetical protein [Schlesneria sp.]